MANKTNRITTILAMKDGTKGALRSAKGGVDGLTNSHKAMKLAAAAAFAAVAAGAVAATRTMVRMTAQMATLGDDMDKLNRRSGLAVESLSEWKYVMERNGSSLDVYEKGIRQLARSMYEAQRGTKTYKDAFVDLGVEWSRDGKLRGVNEVLLEMAERFADLDSEEKKVALSTALLGGRSGTQLLAALRGGREEIIPLLDRVRELNGVMGKDFADASAAFVDAQLDVKTGWESLKRAITFEFIKEGTPFMESLGTALGELSRHIEKNPDIFEDLAGDLAGAATRITADIDAIVTKLDEARESYQNFRQALNDIQNDPVVKTILETLAAGAQMIPKESRGTLAYPDAIKTLIQSINDPQNPINRLMGSSKQKAATTGPIGISPDSIWADLAAPPKKIRAPAASALPGVSAAPVLPLNLSPAPDPAEQFPELFIPGEGVDNSQIMAAIVDQDFGGWLENVKEGLTDVRTATDALKDIGVGFADGFASSIGNSLADAAFYGEDFAETMTDSMRQLAAWATAEMVKLTARIVASKFGIPLPFAQGGMIRAASGLVAGGQPGLDSVPALLMPGEAVVDRATTRGLAQMVDDYRRTQAAGAPSLVVGSGAAIVLNQTFAYPHNHAGAVRGGELGRRMARAIEGRTL